MAKKILINVMHPEEARVAIVEDGRLVELDIEVAGSEQTRGNVYKGVVVRVEPGLQAAFVDIGLKKLGFLQMGELHPEFWQWRDDVPEEQRKRRPRIQEVLRRGQELIVEVEKGERDMKGAALTTYLSLPGRYMVVMPGSDSAGISRKVENEADRKKLKEMASQLDIPEGVGYIIRTEGLGKSKTELNKDLKSLLKLYQEIRTKASKAKAPALIYQELDLVIRTIRDYFTAEVDEVLVDSPEVFKQAKGFFKRTMPKFENLVKLHQEKRPIFSKYQLEEQIDQIHEKKVSLKSGGSLVIEPTEALVSIDVNSGKSTGEKGVEDTAFKTNMEAAEEVARQLRLRDLGGLIVIDFIDMRDKKHMVDVEKTLKNALKEDKARVTVGRISQFGMLEMSRQRIRPTLSEASYLECPHCEGRGKVKSVENMAISFLRKVHAAAAKGAAGEVRGNLPLEVAYYLLNRKKRELAQIEDEYEIAVTVKGKPSFLMNQLDLEQIKREKPLAPEFPGEQVTGAVIPAEEGAADKGGQPKAPAEEEKAKKKRRRKKKDKGEGETLLHPQVSVAEKEVMPAEAEEAGAIPEGPGTEPGDELHQEEHKKKRRRRKRRGAKGHVEEASGMESGEAPMESAESEPEAAEVPIAAPGEGEVHPDEHKKRRRKRKRRSGKQHPADGAELLVQGGEATLQQPGPTQQEMSVQETILQETAVQETAESPHEHGLPGEHKKKRRRRKRSGEKGAGAQLSGDGASEQGAQELPQLQPAAEHGHASTEEPEKTASPAAPKKRAPRRKPIPAAEAASGQPMPAATEPASGQPMPAATEPASGQPMPAAAEASSEQPVPPVKKRARRKKKEPEESTEHAVDSGTT